jgi:HAD superfamily hydrolase (TIGR01509 family)
MTLRAALFDFDETMIHLEPQHEASDRALCAEMGGDYESLPESVRFGSGRRIIDVIRVMREQFGWAESEESLLKRRQEHFLHVCRAATLELMPGVERVVRELYARGLRLVVVSSAVRAPIDEILRRFRIRDLFDLIVDGSDVVKGKPNPEAYLAAAQRIGAAVHECVVFEDSEAGVLAAKAAKMHCVAIRNPQARIFQDLSAADEVLSSFDEFTSSR